MKEATTPGPIEREGTFMWQFDSQSGSGLNLWSGKLDANNGYSQEYALRAATLFEAAPDLLASAQDALIALEAAPDTVTTKIARQKLRAAIARATGA